MKPRIEGAAMKVDSIETAGPNVKVTLWDGFRLNQLQTIIIAASDAEHVVVGKTVRLVLEQT